MVASIYYCWLVVLSTGFCHRVLSMIGAGYVVGCGGGVLKAFNGAVATRNKYSVS